jgi:hypothetical protein
LSGALQLGHGAGMSRHIGLSGFIAHTFSEKPSGHNLKVIGSNPMQDLNLLAGI